MKKKIFRTLCSLILILFAFCAVSFNSTAKAAHAHIFVEGICECGTYYMETGDTLRVHLKEQGPRLYTVTWKTSENAPFTVEKTGSDGILANTTYYAIVEGIKEGEGTLNTYSGDTLVQSVNIYVECRVHSFGEYVPDNNGTCRDGTKTAKCKYCNETSVVTDYGSAVHAVTAYYSNGDATCRKDGTKTGICTLCGAERTIRDENSKRDHDYQNFVYNSDATCVRDGTKTGVCTMCGDQSTVIAEGSVLGHNFENYVSDGNANCENDGTKTAVCTRCGTKDTKTDSGSRLGHYYGTWTVVKEMTCKEDGLETSTCARCNTSKSKVIPASGHNYVLQPEIESTCKYEGRTRGMYCSNCNTVFVASEPIEKKEHVKSQSVDPASLTENGFYMETCVNCDEVFETGTIFRPKSIKLDKTSYIYDGYAKTPVVTVKDVNGQVLTPEKDYKVKYDSSRKKPGEYSVKVSFMGNYEGEKTLTFKICPDKTSKVTATQTTDSITLQWNKVKYATGYRVFLYNTKTGKFEKIKTLTSNKYTIKKLKAGTTYKFAVKAYTKTDSDETIWAKEYTVFTTATKPKNLTVKATAGSKKVSLSWNEVKGATGYQVYIQAPGEDFERIKDTKNTNHTVKKLKRGVTYKFRVRAYITVDGKIINGGYKTFSVTVK